MKNLKMVCSNHPDPIHSTGEWRRKAYGSILCKECHLLNRNIFPEPIDVTLNERPQFRITGGVWWTGVRIFHKSFLEQIKEKIEDFVIGRCFDKDGNLITDFVTCYSKDYIVIRGQKGSKYEICNECNTISPIPGINPHYIPRFYLTNSLIYMDSDCSMYIEENLAKKINFTPWTDLEFETIPIIDKPVDGQILPIDPYN
jgi:hypothetical protein